MKPLYVIVGLTLFIFGIMEIIKEHASTLGFILITIGMVTMLAQLLRWRSDRLDSRGSDFHIDLSDSDGSGGD